MKRENDKIGTLNVGAPNGEYRIVRAENIVSFCCVLSVFSCGLTWR